MKYEYAYEEVEWQGFALWREQAHQDIIARRAADGWRFVGVIPSSMYSNGSWHVADLVFERELT